MSRLQCVIYGSSIVQGRGDEIFLEDKKWKKHYRKPGLLQVDPEELEKKYFMNEKNQWTGLYRLIMYDCSTDDYRLSGIGHVIDDTYPRGFPYWVPNDPATALIGRLHETTHSLKIVYDHELIDWWHNWSAPKNDWRSVNVATHMRCWYLARRVFGSTVEKHLELFIGLAVQKARKLGYGKDETRGIMKPSREPVRCPAVHTIIQESRRRKRAHLSRNPLPPSSRLSLLPYELQCLILDSLDYRDIASLKAAVHYPVTERYWRSRMEKANYLIWMEETSKGDLNWEYLCLEIEKIDATTDIFQTPRRVLRFLLDIKPSFLRNIDQRVYPHLRDVTSVIQDQIWAKYMEFVGGP